jgi:hypothetical protein
VRPQCGMHGKELHVTWQLMVLLLSSLTCELLVATILCTSVSFFVGFACILLFYWTYFNLSIVDETL